MSDAPPTGRAAAASPAAQPTPHAQGLAAELTVLPAGWQLPVAPGQTLLQAALAAGVRLPSSCRNGTCRACLCQRVAGETAYTIEWPGLLAEEKAEGWLLPCVAVAVSPAVSLLAPGASRVAPAA